MDLNVRLYGHPPFQVAVIHGGPGAPGYMAPVARSLSGRWNVIEPLQTKDSLVGQIEELREQLQTMTAEPLVVVGSSWGAVLGLLLAASHPHVVARLILVGSAVFDAQSSRLTKATRLSRTPAQTLVEIEKLERQLAEAPASEKDRWLAKIVDLEFDADVFSPTSRDLELLAVQKEINQKVWNEFVKLRDQDHRLSDLLKQVRCETLIVHGDYDPHVLEGIEPFLRSAIPQVRLKRLEKCGHYPWLEKFASAQFFEILHHEIALEFASESD